MKIIKIFPLIFLLNSITYAQVSYTLPGRDDAAGKTATGSAINVSSDQNFWLNFIKYWTNTLWFILGVVIFAMIVYGGIMLITAQGDDKKIQKANRILINSFIGILITLLAYTIVTLIIRLI